MASGGGAGNSGGGAEPEMITYTVRA